MLLQTLKVLSESDIRQVHDASISILENTGIMVHSNKVLDILKSKGAQIDDTGKIARIPRDMVESALRTIPKSFNLYDRNRKNAFTIGDGIPRCVSGHNAIFIIDAHTCKRRNSTVKDVEKFALLSDRLEDIDIVGVPVMPQDVTPEATLIYAVKTLFENTCKPVFFSTESSAVNEAVIKLMKIVAGKDDISECPAAISQLSPTSPLTWEEGAVEALVAVAREGIPLNILPEPMSGVSAPYTVAGLLTMHNTEVLSGIVISQLVRPGAPVIYGSSWTAYDMKHTNAIIGSPETSLLRIAGCQMAKYYSMPSHTTAPNSDANAHDEQNAWEKAISNLCAICAGNDLVVNSGMFATGLTISLEQLVLDDELNGIIRRLRRGIDINPDTIGRDVINSVGPKGTFFMEDHTFQYLRSGEFREVKVSNTKNYDQWFAKGAPDVVKNAEMHVARLLAECNANPLDHQKIELMEAVIRDFEKDLVRK